ncbi:MAG: TonB-dependent receptor [Rhizomicrobium sp.]|nr:TonB-dependent receptor [Rhizomicrobium sp.]
MQRNISRMARLLMGSTILVGVGAALGGVAAQAQDMETVTVTGYRASLLSSTVAKRDSVNLTDSVFAEDIGKFPDTNVAEAFNRIPGMTISRENDGTGVRVAIRGLDTNHVKITLNGTDVQTPTSGQTGAQGTNREVDLNIFPIELFSKLSVSKTSTADQLEGGSAGVIEMRSNRPFDNPGAHFSYNMQMTDFARNGTPGERGTLMGSYTDGPFGVLVGISGQVNRITVKAYEGASNNVTTPNLNNVMYYGTQANPTPTQTCATTTIAEPGLTATTTGNTCNTMGGNTDWNPPAVVPNTGVPAQYVGKVLTSDILTALNPGLSIDQISNAMVPRTGGPGYETGDRDRYNAIVSLEYRPTDALHFYLDGILGVIGNHLDRSRVFFIARSGASIPMNMKVDANNVVTYADFANGALQEENRPYKESADFMSVNPGMDWQITDKLHVDAQVNGSRGHFFRDSPTYLFSTVSGVVHYDNTSGIPDITMSGLTGTGGTNDPTNWGYGNGAALRLAQERRYEYTEGAHANASYGGDVLKLTVGAAYDEKYRSIVGYDNGSAWSDYACGAGLNIAGTPTIVPTPNTTTTCTLPTPGRPAYAGYGTGYTSGWGTLASAGPALPNTAIAQYGHASNFGMVRWDYAALNKATDYTYFATTPSNGAAANLQEAGRTNFSSGLTTGGSAGIIDEKVMGFYAELAGTVERGSQKVKYLFGGRWTRSEQILTAYNTVTDPRNATLADGGKYPNYYVPTTLKGSYSSFLPSANVVWEMMDDFQLRAAVSRTMTRANPASMMPVLGGGGSDGLSWTLGNPNLRPYYSTNLDLGATLFTGGEGYIGAGWFKKMMTGFPNNYSTVQPFTYLAQFGRPYSSFTDPIASSLKAAAINQGCYDAVAQTVNCLNVTVTQARNASGLETIKGFEFNWVQPLDFILKDAGLPGFGFTANATFISTKTTPNSAAPSVVLGVSPTQYNIVGYYENDGIMVRATYNYTRGTIVGSNVYGLIANLAVVQAEYSRDFAVADISSSVKLSKFFGELPSDPDLTFDVQNLFHAKNSLSYKQFTNLANQVYNPGSIFMFGVRGSL